MPIKDKPPLFVFEIRRLQGTIAELREAPRAIILSVPPLPSGKGALRIQQDERVRIVDSTYSDLEDWSLHRYPRHDKSIALTSAFSSQAIEFVVNHLYIPWRYADDNMDLNHILDGLERK